MCTLECGEDGLLVLHHADGGFRRLRVEGSTITAADGAELAATRHVGGATEVTIGGMRYRLADKGATAGQ